MSNIKGRGRLKQTGKRVVMHRITITVTPAILKKADADAKKLKISRSLRILQVLNNGFGVQPVI